MLLDSFLMTMYTRVVFVLMFYKTTAESQQHSDESGEIDTSSVLTSSTSLRSYCESETFYARCWDGHVISMRHATYGRMKIGRCVEADLGYLGCQADVLPIVHRKCSGRPECRIRVPDGDLDKTKPCYKELKVYLDADYSCLKVSEDSPDCSIYASPHPSHLSSLSPSKHGCGSPSTPWRISVDPGQTIKLALIDFSPSAPQIFQNFPNSDDRTSGPRQTKPCIQYGYIRESGGPRNVSICGGGNQTQQFIYQSTKNTLEIVLPNTGGGIKNLSGVLLPAEKMNFLLQFQSIGCADVRPLRDAWMERRGDELVVGCNSTRQTWHLHCNSNQWSGVIGNCTQHLMVSHKLAQLTSPSTFLTHEVLIILVVAISLTLCLIIVASGLACLRCSYLKASRKAQPLAHHPTYNPASYDHCQGFNTNKKPAKYFEKSLPALPPGALGGYTVSHVTLGSGSEVVGGMSSHNTVGSGSEFYRQSDGYTADTFCSPCPSSPTYYESTPTTDPSARGLLEETDHIDLVDGPMKSVPTSGGYFALERQRHEMRV